MLYTVRVRCTPPAAASDSRTAPSIHAAEPFHLLVSRRLPEALNRCSKEFAFCRIVVRSSPGFVASATASDVLKVSALDWLSRGAASMPNREGTELHASWGRCTCEVLVLKDPGKYYTISTCLIHGTISVVTISVQSAIMNGLVLYAKSNLWNSHTYVSLTPSGRTAHYNAIVILCRLASPDKIHD
jgi:hypothetical protein